MIINRLIVKNWRNFQQIDVPLRERQFIVGPNASGKSNLLDIFRFLRDIAKPEGGGLQKAVNDRGGVSKIRCLSARQDPEVTIEIHIADTPDDPAIWRYNMGFRQENHGHRQIHLTHERVWREGALLLDRPDADDNEDPDRLTQTALEQMLPMRSFERLDDFFVMLPISIWSRNSSVLGMQFKEKLLKTTRLVRDFSNESRVCIQAPAVPSKGLNIPSKLLSRSLKIGICS